MATQNLTVRKLLLLPGDGIGPEVMAEVKRLIDWMNKQGLGRFVPAHRLVQLRQVVQAGGVVGVVRPQMLTSQVTSLGGQAKRPLVLAAGIQERTGRDDGPEVRPIASAKPEVELLLEALLNSGQETAGRGSVI